MQLTKATIHIEPDDDITSITSKVRQSDARIIALVPAKRSRVLSSVVNLKLLRKMSNDIGKTVVLISGEENVQKLADSVGLPYSADLKTKPIIPVGDKASILSNDMNIEAEKATVVSGTDPVKEAPVAAVAKPAVEQKVQNEKPIEVKDSKSKPTKKKVPNFGAFRKKLFGIGFAMIAALIGVGAYFYLTLPEANIVITAQTRRVNVSETFTINESLVTAETPLVDSVTETLTDTITEEFEATGEQNEGNRASGVVTVQNCDSSTDVTIESGTGFSVGNLNFSSQGDVLVPGGTFSGGGCSSPGIAEVQIVANRPGSRFNIEAGEVFAISGQSGFVNGDGGAITGGTDDIVKVVSQEDIDQAVEAISPRAADQIQDELSNKFGASIVVLEDSFSFTQNDPESDRDVDEVADGGSVSITYTYEINGVVKSELDSIVENRVAAAVMEQESIFESGSDSLNVESFSGSEIFTVNATGLVGPDLDIDALKESLEGLRFSDTQSTIEAIPGVRSVELNFSPFWVNETPSPSRTNITIDIDERN